VAAEAVPVSTADNQATQAPPFRWSEAQAVQVAPGWVSEARAARGATLSGAEAQPAEPIPVRTAEAPVLYASAAPPYAGPADNSARHAAFPQKMAGAEAAAPTAELRAPHSEARAEIAGRPLPETGIAQPGLRNEASPAPIAVAAADAAPPAAAAPTEALSVLGLGGSDWRLDPASGPGADASLARNIPATPPREIAQQLAAAIDRAAGDKIEIRLDPPELGRVQIELRIEDGRLHAAILTERPEVQDLMRRHADLLIRELEAAGHGRVSLDFASGSGERQDQGERPPQPSLRAVYETGAPVAHAADGPARRTTLSGLDIRL
jgi:flagellar hook-length control protein FliK